MIRIDHLDHVVLTVASIEETCAFYGDVLGMRTETFAGGRKALHFGGQKINLHEKGREFEPRARVARPGAADLCLIAETPLDAVIEHLAACGVPVEEGPVAKSGAVTPLISVYIRDPDGNLIEISNEVPTADLRPPARIAGRALSGAALGAGSAGALAIGATALGAFAVGALAIGALAIGRISVGKARIRRLEIDELIVRNEGGPEA